MLEQDEEELVLKKKKLISVRAIVLASLE